MLLKEAIQILPGFKYIYESLEFLSSAGRKKMLQRSMLDDIFILNKHLDLTENFLIWWKNPKNDAICRRLEHCLMKFHDIESTLKSLQKGVTLDDISLYEIKLLAIISEEVRQIIESSGVKDLHLNNLERVIDILDPEHTGTSYFYIYDAYSPILAELRKTLKTEDPESERALNIFSEIVTEENKIKETLSIRLKEFSSLLLENSDVMAEIDCLITLIKFIIKENLSRPHFNNKDKIIWKGLFNVAIRKILKEKGTEFQPVDFELSPGVALITGANMGGKTVLLKSLALAQAMIQFGFYAPATVCDVQPVSKISLSIGDDQNENDGLSSFAAELKKINDAVVMARSVEKTLILIDEPARTTNPEEGRAITASLLDFFESRSSFVVITTHYSGIVTKKRYRVKGLEDFNNKQSFISGKLENDKQLLSGGIKEFSKYMDYSLIEDSDSDAPHEALKIAELLGFDIEIVNNAKRKILDDKYS